MIPKKIISERKLKYYVIRKELWSFGMEDNPPAEITSAYSHDGLYLGEVDDVKHLVRKYGIVYFHKRTPESSVASIGFSPRKQQWFGWSHRAVKGFGIGDYMLEPGPGLTFINGKIITTLDEAEEAARQFALLVS